MAGFLPHPAMWASASTFAFQFGLTGGARYLQTQSQYAAAQRTWAGLGSVWRWSGPSAMMMTGLRIDLFCFGFTECPPLPALPFQEHRAYTFRRTSPRPHADRSGIHAASPRAPRTLRLRGAAFP